MATEKPSAPKPGVIDIPFSAGRADNFSPATAPRGEILKSAAVAPRASSATEETPITRANLSMKPQVLDFCLSCEISAYARQT